MLKRLFLILLPVLCLVTMAFGQKSEQSSFVIETDSVFSAENESLVALTVFLSNPSESVFEGEIRLKVVEGISLVGKGSSLISLDAHSKVYHPIRLAISKNVPAGKTPVILQLVDKAGDIKAEFKSTLLVQPKRQVVLINNRPTELMQNVGDSLTVSALLSNRGNSQEMITVTAAFPNLTGGNKIERKQISLNSFQDTVIVFKNIITRELLSLERYTINIAALYANGELINNVMVGVQNVSGNRTYAHPSQGYSFDSYSSNRINLSGRNLFTPNEALQLNASAAFPLPTGNLDFNIDGYLYTKTNYRPLLTNTYLNYKVNNKGMTLGNISENLETFINGRGLKVYAGNEEESRLVEVGLVDKTYNLLGDEYTVPGGNGYTAYAKAYFSNESDQQYLGSVLYDRTPYNHSESVIQINEYRYRLKSNVQLSFELGGGLTRTLNDPSSFFKPSLAVGNKLSGVFGKYSVSSNNFFSSGYYPGTRRGMIQLNERVSRSFNKLNTWVSYSYYHYNPKYLSQHFYYSQNASNSQVEGGTYFPLSNNAYLSISAKHHADQGRAGYFSDDTSPMVKMNAFRVTESINWRSRDDQHMVNLSSENGFSKSPFTGKRQLQIRANGTWNYRFFSLNSYFQQGDFSIMEAYSNAQQGGKDVYRFNVSTGLRNEFFDKKLKAQLDVNYNRDSYSGSNWMYSGLANYAFSPLFSAFVNTYFYNYRSSYFNSSYSNIQAGVSYNLPSKSMGSGQKKGNLNLFLFYDNNANGVFDEGDIAAEGSIVMIGGVSFITQSDGSINYKKVPYGQYSLSVPSQNWYADAPSEVDLQSRDLKLNIPLKKTSKITGSLYYHYDKLTSEEVFEKYGGLRLMLSGDNNFKSQSLSNAKGEFTLFVPVGEYEFWVDENSLPKNVYTDFQPQKVRVLEGSTVVIPAIELKVKQRAVEVKRFTSD